MNTDSTLYQSIAGLALATGGLLLIPLIPMAFAQSQVAVAALIGGMHQVPGSSINGILGVNGFLIVLFVAADLLIRYTARNREQTT